MLKVIAFVLAIILNGCSVSNPAYENILREQSKKKCRRAIKDDGMLINSRKSCLRVLNLDYTKFTYYVYAERKYRTYTKQECSTILNDYRASWQKLDQKIISYAKEQNEPLPENFKTVEEIFREYPNPCSFEPDGIYWGDNNFEKAVREYNEKQKEK